MMLRAVGVALGCATTITVVVHQCTYTWEHAPGGGMQCVQPMAGWPASGIPRVST